MVFLLTIRIETRNFLASIALSVLIRAMMSVLPSVSVQLVDLSVQPVHFLPTTVNAGIHAVPKKPFFIRNKLKDAPSHRIRSHVFHDDFTVDFMPMRQALSARLVGNLLQVDKLITPPDSIYKEKREKQC